MVFTAHSQLFGKYANPNCYNRLFCRNTPFQASLNSKILLRCFYLLVFQEIWSTYEPINIYLVTVYNTQAPVTPYWFKSWVHQNCKLTTKGCRYDICREPPGSRTLAAPPCHFWNVMLWWMETWAPLWVVKSHSNNYTQNKAGLRM